MTMKAVTCMNNSATLLIETGHYKEALDILGSCLEIVRTELDNKPDDDEKMGGCKKVYSSTDSQDLQARKKISNVESFEPDEDFIYRHPIRANNLPADEGDYIMSVIVCFNMALCHHLFAIEGGPRDYVNRLNGALKLYELGFCMQMKGDINMDMTFGLAMVNNCAQIYKAMNRKSKAQKFSKHMLSFLMMMIENGEAETVDELDGFLWNASRLILKENVAQAA
jgi:hypothetical protein